MTTIITTIAITLAISVIVFVQGLSYYLPLLRAKIISETEKDLHEQYRNAKNQNSVFIGYDIAVQVVRSGHKIGYNLEEIIQALREIREQANVELEIHNMVTDANNQTKN